MCANPTRPALWRIQRCIKVWVYWMAVFVPPTSKKLMYRRSAGEVYYMSGRYGRSVALKTSCQDCSGVEDSPVVNNSRIE